MNYFLLYFDELRLCCLNLCFNTVNFWVFLSYFLNCFFYGFFFDFHFFFCNFGNFWERARNLPIFIIFRRVVISFVALIFFIVSITFRIWVLWLLIIVYIFPLFILSPWPIFIWLVYFLLFVWIPLSFISGDAKNKCQKHNHDSEVESTFSHSKMVLI